MPPAQNKNEMRCLMAINQNEECYSAVHLLHRKSHP